jgi:hypothetical protein
VVYKYLKLILIATLSKLTLSLKAFINKRLAPFPEVIICFFVLIPSVEIK